MKKNFYHPLNTPSITLSTHPLLPSQPTLYHPLTHPLNPPTILTGDIPKSPKNTYREKVRNQESTSLSPYRTYNQQPSSSSSSTHMLDQSQQQQQELGYDSGNYHIFITYLSHVSQLAVDEVSITVTHLPYTLSPSLSTQTLTHLLTSLPCCRLTPYPSPLGITTTRRSKSQPLYAEQLAGTLDLIVQVTPLVCCIILYPLILHFTDPPLLLLYHMYPETSRYHPQHVID